MILNSADYRHSSHIYLTFILQLSFALKEYKYECKHACKNIDSNPM